MAGLKPLDGAFRPGSTIEPTAADLVALHVSRLFYEEQLAKTEIAHRLGISRFRVARLIERARATGLVRVEYQELSLVDDVLSRQLAERYGLRLCVVLRSLSDSSAMIDAVGGAAAAVVGELIGRDDIIGLGWGRSVAAVVDHIPSHLETDLQVVQLAGGSARIAFGIDPSELARRLAARLGGTLRAIHAPAFVETGEIRDALLREPDVYGAVELFDHLTLAVIGIGSLTGADRRAPASSLSIEGALSSEALDDLLAAGAVGELMLHAFDADGRFVGASVSDRAVAISVEQLRRARRVVAVAFGIEKGPAIAGALRTGVPTMLVTDEMAARWVLSSMPS